jgi:hypothetical protein
LAIEFAVSSPWVLLPQQCQVLNPEAQAWVAPAEMFSMPDNPFTGIGLLTRPGELNCMLELPPPERSMVDALIRSPMPS